MADSKSLSTQQGGNQGQSLAAHAEFYRRWLNEINLMDLGFHSRGEPNHLHPSEAQQNNNHVPHAGEQTYEELRNGYAMLERRVRAVEAGLQHLAERQQSSRIGEEQRSRTMKLQNILNPDPDLECDGAS